ncbi:hypothetical protein KSB_08320 [Ktedonobacter robiniae]|uniref:Uncharacterized protein n=1 Tax=Ktedonobacter robiniae TaxID=2778365 RepID=A0ABQ3UI17_9CHLR|nr:hypothetical protein KSB_08320 [Ktedonobacter robiniae]
MRGKPLKNNRERRLAAASSAHTIERQTLVPMAERIYALLFLVAIQILGVKQILFFLFFLVILIEI